MKIYLPFLTFCMGLAAASPNMRGENFLAKEKDKDKAKDKCAKKVQGRCAPLDFPNDVPKNRLEFTNGCVRPEHPLHGDARRRLVKGVPLDFMPYLNLRNVQAQQCLGFDNSGIGAPAVLKPCDVCDTTPEVFYTTDKRLMVDSDCWPPLGMQCLDGFNDLTLWPCRSYYTEQIFELEQVDDQRYYFIRNEFFGLYVTRVGFGLTLQAMDAFNQGQWWTDADYPDGGIPCVWFASTVSAT